MTHEHIREQIALAEASGDTQYQKLLWAYDAAQSAAGNGSAFGSSPEPGSALAREMDYLEAQ